jgi:hypothetical protein
MGWATPPTDGSSHCWLGTGAEGILSAERYQMSFGLVSRCILLYFMQMASVVLRVVISFLACFLFFSFLASVIGLTPGKNGSIKLRSRFGSEAQSPFV